MKVLIAYFSLRGKTEKMAEYIAEGVRFSGQQAEAKKISDIKSANDLVGYDGYIFGSPTYHRDMAEPMKTFLFLAKKANFEGKLAGAFGSYTHSGDAPALIFDTMQYVYKMEPFELGALNLKEAQLEETGKGEPSHRQYIAGEVHGEAGEGMRACQDYGKVFGQKLGS
ncbi:flavodoxin domain-containing protein [Chloroflexota bacterium]